MFCCEFWKCFQNTFLKERFDFRLSGNFERTHDQSFYYFHLLVMNHNLYAAEID